MSEEDLKSLICELDASVEKVLVLQESLIDRIDCVQSDHVKEVIEQVCQGEEDPSIYTEKIRNVKLRLARITETIDRVKRKLERVENHVSNQV
jgi:hypothetical protein